MENEFKNRREVAPEVPKADEPAAEAPKEETPKEEKIHRLEEKNPDFDTKSGHYAVIVSKKDDMHFRFEMPFGAPLSECYLAAVEVLKEIKFTYEAAVKEAEKKKAEEAAAEQKSEDSEIKE